VAYVGVRVLVYLIGLLLMVLVYGTKQRGLIIAPPVAVVGAAGTWYLLGDTPLDPRRRLINAAGVGLLLAELTWALGYWDIAGAGLVGGATLWLAFYVLSGVVEHAAALNLDRRIGIEYAVVALVGTIGILWSAHPWSA
jgi:Protein of unknown function (DUF5656)